MDLFGETEIGGLRARNHFVRSATAEGRASPDGAPTDRVGQTYLALARGEVGTIVTSLTSVAPYERASRNQLAIDRDDLADAFREVVESVHAEGARIVMQLFHGSSTSQVDPENSRVLGPSAIANPLSGIVPREMDADDMREVVRLFAAGAARAKAAGFDAVQLHGAHGCLLSQFLLPSFNRRTDGYGGSAEDRFRFVGEVVSAVRYSVDEDFPVWIKVDATDVAPGLLPLEDFLRTGELLDAAGVAAIEVSGLSQPRAYEHAYYRKEAEALAERVGATVILTGGIRSLEDMEAIALESRVRHFGMARPFMHRPDYVQMLKASRR